MCRPADPGKRARRRAPHQADYGNRLPCGTGLLVNFEEAKQSFLVSVAGKPFSHEYLKAQVDLGLIRLHLTIQTFTDTTDTAFPGTAGY